MYLGSKADDTLFDIFKVGYTELVRQSGMPDEIRFKNSRCEMLARGTDLSTRIDALRIAFPLKSGFDGARVESELQAKGVIGVVQSQDGTCAVTIGPFDWSQLAELGPVDEVVENAAARTLRSRSWEVKTLSYKKQGLNVNRMIELMQAERASDLHLRAGAPPFIRVDSDLRPLDMACLSAEDLEDIVHQLGSRAEVSKLEAERETSFQFHAAGVGYLRVSGYYKQGAMALALRLIPEAPVPFEELNIPLVVRGIAEAHRGLLLVAGITGCGKTTTLASLIDYINATRHAHIITIEDPIEYVYHDKQSIISQRQVGRDTFSFANALRGALREDPDVILVGEMRDTETIRAALSAAETGHLVFSTLHTTTAVDTVNRVISFFPQNERDLIRQELAYSLRGVVCQRLLRRKGSGRIPCVEILLGGRPIVRDAILESEIDKLHSIIEVDADMKTFDQHAVELYQQDLISKDEAVSACSNEEAFERVISGIKSSEGRKILK